jgi:hypothetical protein
VTDTGSGGPSEAWTQPSPSAVPPPPGVPPPPSGTGAAWNPPPPAWAPAGPGYYPPKTNSTAVVSLIFGIGQFVVCPFVGAIVAIITGHVAQGQIKRSAGRETGSGMARAGTILGYVGLALTVLGITALIVTFGVFGDDIARATLRSEARDFVDNAGEIALSSGTDIRDPDTLRFAYNQTDFDGDFDTMRLADGTPIETATEADWERVDWQVELKADLFGDAYVCAQIPETVGIDPVVSNGRCPV